MTRILLIRHGETEWNAEGRIQGQTDVSLNATGRAQAERAAATLANTPIAAVYASDLGRAAETARLLAAPHNLPVTLLPGLRERDWGVWEGRTMRDIEAADPGLAARHAAGHWVDPEGAETFAAFQRRAAAAVERIAGENFDGTILVATHGGTAKMITGWALRILEDARGNLRGPSNLGAAILRHQEGRIIVEAYNVPPPYFSRA